MSHGDGDGRKPVQLNLLGGILDKADGVDQAIVHGDEWYETQFLRRIRSFQLGAHFTVDDVVPHVGLPPGNPNLVGALFSTAKKLGYCESTGRHTRAQRRERHAGMVLIWRRT